MTVQAALAAARAMGLDRVDTTTLLGHVLGRDRAWLIAHDGDALGADTAAAYADLCRQCANGMPVAYLVGEREFHGLRLTVTPDVLVPRPDTETLVDWALEHLAGQPPGARVLDLGTGSGAIALAVAHRQPLAQVWASDVSAAAVAVARANGQRLGLAVQWLLGNWWQAVPGGACFELLLSNPPYIAGDDGHLPALRHEPQLALTPGGDGLDAIRHIVAGAPNHLAPGGWLLLEHGWDQAAAVAALLHAAGLDSVTTRVDIEGRPRCTGGRLPLR